MPPTPPSDDCGDSSATSSPGSTTSTLSVKHQTATQNLRQTPLQRQQAIRHQHHIQASPYSVNPPLFVSPVSNFYFLTCLIKSICSDYYH